MTDILQLENFQIIKMQVEIVYPQEQLEDEENTIPEHNFGVDYKVFRKTNDEFRYKMSLVVSIEPRNFGWKVDSQIDGYFLCPKESTIPEREGIIRINGGTILYGLLRGQLSAFTGSFPNGPFVLPTINMIDVVKAKEEQEGNIVKDSTE